MLWLKTLSKLNLCNDMRNSWLDIIFCVNTEVKPSDVFSRQNNLIMYEADRAHKDAQTKKMHRRHFIYDDGYP